MQFDNIISPGDDCFISPFDSYNVEWNITSAQFMKRNVQNFCRFAHFGTNQDQCATKRRIMDMGITKGASVHIRKVAPLGDLVEVTVRGYELSLRKEDAEKIEVE